MERSAFLRPTAPQWIPSCQGGISLVERGDISMRLHSAATLLCEKSVAEEKGTVKKNGNGMQE